MGQIKWYKRDPDAALSGMMGLSLEERGAYNTVLDLIYTRDGNLPDDDRFIAGWLSVDVRVWKRIKERLVSLGKLRVEAGMLRNSRADVEVSNALSRVGSARDAGKASARKRGGKYDRSSRENSDLAPTGVETGDATAVPTNHNYIHNKREEPIGSSAPTPKRAHQLPSDFEPKLTEAAQRQADQLGPARLESELQRFRDYHAARGSTMKDWQAAFRTWLSNAVDRMGVRPNEPHRHPPRDNRDGFTQAIDRRLGLGADGRVAGASG